MSVESYCISENEVSSNDVISPSGKYKLTIKSYRTKEGCWNFTSGAITRVSDNGHIATINRNYHGFNHSFFNRGGVEWFWTGKTYLSQCFVNLETGETYDNSQSETITSSSFCWAEVIANPSGTILAVVGCVWGGSYEILFYDFSDPSKGWPIIPLHYQADYELNADQDYELKWVGDATVEYTLSRQSSDLFDDLTIEQLPDSDEVYNKEFHYGVVLEKKDGKMCHIKNKVIGCSY